jgi:hypothetical protein
MTGGPAEGTDAVARPDSTAPDSSAPAPSGEAVVRSTLLADAIGGPRGLLDTGIPAVVFVIVNAVSSLTPAIYAALGFGVVLLTIRLVRRQPVQQAVAGFIGIGIAAFVASRTHSAEGFFLPGILYQAALAIAAAVSLVVRRPLIGFAMAALDPRFSDWRRNPKLLRAMDLATIVWGSVFLLRAVVQGLLYLAHHAGWLAVVQLAMGWPLFAAALATSYALARRAAPAGEPQQGEHAEKEAEQGIEQAADSG